GPLALGPRPLAWPRSVAARSGLRRVGGGVATTGRPATSRATTSRAASDWAASDRAAGNGAHRTAHLARCVAGPPADRTVVPVGPVAVVRRAAADVARPVVVVAAHAKPRRDNQRERRHRWSSATPARSADG